MLKVYNLMALGLAITGVAALGTMMLATTNDPAAAAATLGNGKMLTALGVALYGSPLKWVVHARSARHGVLPERPHPVDERLGRADAFWVFAGLMGLSLSSIFLVYTRSSIVQTFFITAASFGALSLWGYTTKRDLTGMGTFLFMGVIGLIIAMVVNIFLASPALQFAISAIGVLIFAGLTAYDTQKIKEMYFEGDEVLVSGRKAIMGALTLYLDFINLFTLPAARSSATASRQRSTGFRAERAACGRPFLLRRQHYSYRAMTRYPSIRTRRPRPTCDAITAIYADAVQTARRATSSSRRRGPRWRRDSRR